MHTIFYEVKTEEGEKKIEKKSGSWKK